MTAPEPDALVLLTACADPETAALIKAKLQAAGLHVVLQGEQHRAMLGALGSYVEPRLLVKASELDQARALIVPDPGGTMAEADLGAPDLAARHDRDDEASASRSRRRRRWMALAVLLLPAVALLIPAAVVAVRGHAGHVVTGNGAGVSLANNGQLLSYGNNAINGNQATDGAPSGPAAPKLDCPWFEDDARCPS